MATEHAVLTLTPSVWRATKRNALVEDLSDDMVDGEATVDYQNLVPGSFRGRFRRLGAWTDYADCLAVFLKISYGDGTSVTEQIGLYVPLPSPHTHAETEEEIEVEARDLTWLLSVDTTSDSYTVAVGTSYVGAVRTLLDAADLTRHNISSDGDRTTTTDISWGPGTSKLEIVNHLLQGCEHHPLSTDRTGRLVSAKVGDLTTTEPAATYGAGSVVGTVRHDPDTTTLCNHVVVVKDNPGEAPLVATLTNDNPASPTSTVALGVTISRVVRDPYLADQAAADALARKVLEEGSAVYNVMTLETLPDLAGIDGRVVAIDLKGRDGSVVDDGTWWRRGWALPLAAGTMRHELGKLTIFEGV